jgi:hypothetical protein
MGRKVCDKDIGSLHMLVKREVSTKVFEYLRIAPVFTSTLSFVSWKILKIFSGVI